MYYFIDIIIHTATVFTRCGSVAGADCSPMYPPAAARLSSTLTFFFLKFVPYLILDTVYS